MQKQFSHNRFIGLLAIAISFIFSSCDKKKTNPEPDVQVNYAIANVGGAWPSQTTYIQGLTDLNMSNLTNSNATELANWGQMWTYKNMLFVTRWGAPATMFKYTFDSKGKAVEAGRILVPGANTFSTIQFVDDNKAYASVAGGLARLVIFDPTSFQITGEVNLNSIQKSNAKSAWYLGSAVRDTLLFWGVQYSDASGASFDTAYVAVINMKNNTVVKLLADPRTCMVFSSGGASSGFATDANGDIYVMGFGSSATSNAAADAPSGVLRIKNGETEFDPTYFFDLRNATGNDCMGLYHFGSGLAFTCRMEDSNDPWEYINNAPNYKFYRIDLASKTSYGEVAGLPKVFGSSSSLIRKFDNENLLINTAGASENAIYNYSISGGTVSKKFTMNGICTGLAKMN
jgi:hypothetical protein